MSVSPPISYADVLESTGGGLWEVMSREGAALTDGIGAFMEETPQSSQTPSTREKSATRKKAFTGTCPGRHPVLGLPASKTPAGKPPSLGCSVRAAPVNYGTVPALAHLSPSLLGAGSVSPSKEVKAERCRVSASGGFTSL